MRKNLVNKLDSAAYFMGAAWILAAKSPTKRACLVSEGKKILSIGVELPIGYEESKASSICGLCEIEAIRNCKPVNNAAIYFTFTPSYQTILSVLTVQLIKKIVFLKTDELEQQAKDACALLFVDLIEYDSGFSWIQDYFYSNDYLQISS